MEMDLKLSQGHHQASTQKAKSYTCNFCKRGFSNAQALGGHMNIHRKDRAKLKESAEEIPKLRSGEEKKLNPIRDSNRKVKKLYCFVETSSSQNFRETNNHFNGDAEKNIDLISSLVKPELDLELRLGLEHMSDDQ